MDILDTIIAFKRKEVEAAKGIFPVAKLEASSFFKLKMPDFHKALTNPGPAIIAEFKRKSPSKGIINTDASPVQVAQEYQEGGIAAISILTDNEFFGGSNNDLQSVAGFVKVPLLRKDFIIDDYQVIEAKSIGASAILLIASVLSKKEVARLSGLAFNLGIEVLFEIHDEKDLYKMNNKIKILGVNNRNLKTFNVNFDNSSNLIGQLPANCIKVAESGFQTTDDVKRLFLSGYNAFLIGEKFMGTQNPGKTATDFVNDLKEKMK